MEVAKSLFKIYCKLFQKNNYKYSDKPIKPGSAKNISTNARKILLYNYCQLWVRSYDHNVTPDIAQQCSPRQRRLLGDLGYDFQPGSHFYVPKDQEEVMQTA